MQKQLIGLYDENDILEKVCEVKTLPNGEQVSVIRDIEWDDLDEVSIINPA